MAYSKKLKPAYCNLFSGNFRRQAAVPLAGNGRVVTRNFMRR
jgi:hypothetical protein